MHGRPRKAGVGRRRPPLQEQRFSSYLVFGFHATACLAIFLVIYALCVFGITLSIEEENEMRFQQRNQDGNNIQAGHNKVIDALHYINKAPGQRIADSVIGAFKKKLNDFRQKKGFTDASLIDKATAELEMARQRRRQESERAVNKTQLSPALANPAPGGKRTGFVVLGMHRSGTSMLSGLLVIGFGYNVGGPLIGGKADNVKGFFERLDVVVQNDEFLKMQKAAWLFNVISYDYKRALEDKKSGAVRFGNGERALAFFNNPSNAPWLQKDPRMCITLKTWLALLNSEPAVVFTYRHPIEVAMSLMKREKRITLEQGLRLWIVYNMRAIQNSAGLCRVYTSNEAVVSDPMAEVTRIKEDLSNKCGVPPPPQEMTDEVVSQFVDPDLQHNRKQRELEDEQRKVIAEYNEGSCKVRELQTTNLPESEAYKRELKLYEIAMKIFCDMESGEAYKDNYMWPSLPP